MSVMSVWRLGACALLGGLLAASPSAARGEDLPRVGVVVGLAVNVDEAEAGRIVEALAEALRSTLAVDVVAGREVERRLPPEGLADDCIGQPACLRDLGARLDAGELLFLVLARVGERVQLDPSHVTLPSAEVVSREAFDFDPRGELELLFAEAAPRLLPAARLRPPPVAGERVRTELISPARIPAVVVGGLAVVAAGVGAGLGLAALGDQRALERDRCDVVACDPGRVDRMEQRALVADVLFGTAVLGAVLGAVLFFTAEDDEVQLAPAVGPGGAGVTLGGRF